MSIESLEDWNTRLGYCGCCEMTECDTPDHECQNKAVTVTPCGYMVATVLEDALTAETIEVPCPDQCAWFQGYDIEHAPTEKIEYTSGDSYVMTATVKEVYRREKNGTACNQSVEWRESGSSTSIYLSPGIGDPDRIEVTWEVNIVDGEGAGSITTTNYFGDGSSNSSTEELTTSNLTVYGATLTDWAQWVASGSEVEVTVGGLSTTTLTFDTTLTFTGELGAERLGLQAQEELDAEDWAAGDTCTALRTAVNEQCGDPPGDVTGTLCWSSLSETIIRYRFKIPYPWERSDTQKHGTYYRLSWDHLFTPQEWSDYQTDLTAWTAARAAWVAADPNHRDLEDYTPAEPDAPEVRTNLIDATSWTWTYPTGEWAEWATDYGAWYDDDPETRGAAPVQPGGDNPWYSGWYDLQVPRTYENEAPKLGTVEIANARLICYHGLTHGVMPQPDPDFEEFDRHPDR